MMRRVHCESTMGVGRGTYWKNQSDLVMVKEDEQRDLEELGSRFGSKLRLSNKECGGIKIYKKAVEGVLLGFQFTLIAEVLTSKEVSGVAFIDCFSSL